VGAHLDQFMDGEHVEAWDRLRALGPAAFSEDFAEDARSVAAETARRVDANIDQIVGRLTRIGYRFGSSYTYNKYRPEQVDEYGLVRKRPSRGIRKSLERLEARIGRMTGNVAPLPHIVWALAEHVGDVSLRGSADRWSPPTYRFMDRPPGVPTEVYADPLEIAGLEQLKFGVSYFSDKEFMADLDGTKPCLLFASDVEGKANHSGGTQEIEWPSWTADPVLRYAARHGRPPLTVVQYLRESFQWGGFPGFADYPDTAPTADIEFLAADLEPI